jgi:hypothetical protein
MIRRHKMAKQKLELKDHEGTIFENIIACDEYSETHGKCLKVKTIIGRDTNVSFIVIYNGEAKVNTKFLGRAIKYYNEL